MKKEKIIEIVWFLVITVIFIVSIKLIRSGELEREIAMFGVWAPFILVFLKATTLVIAPLGGTPLYILGGAMFGNVNGLLLTLLGDVIGSSICFYLSRLYGVKVISFFAGSQNVDKILKIVSLVENSKSFVKARFAFISMPEFLSYASGLSKINFWKFTIINIIFYIPVDAILVFFGSKIATVSLKYFFVYPLVLGIFALAGFVALYKDYEKVEGL